MARTRYSIFDSETPYFLTDTIVAWLPIFAYPQFADIILESWKFLQERRSIHIYGYVVMENHIHWIASGRDLNDQIGRFKSYTALQIVTGLRNGGFETILQELRYFRQKHKAAQEFQVWQEGSHPQEIQNEDMMRQKLEYIHLNPVRRGYVEEPEHWRYSSARDYANGVGLISITTQW